MAFLRKCCSSNCQNPSERSKGSCMICAQHLCALHRDDALHACPKLEADADKYYNAYDAAAARYQSTVFASINLEELCAVATSLRRVPCHVPDHDGVDDLFKSQMGGQNCHIDLVFDDGCVWIARLRLDAPYIAPAAARDYVTRSEVATLKFLEATAVPTPRVHHYTLSDNVDKVGVAYILMDKISGKQLDWSSIEDESAKLHLISQLADIYQELYRHPLQQQGSLIDDAHSQTPVIGQSAHPPLFLSPIRSLGPFNSAQAAGLAIVDAYISRYATGELDDFAAASVVTHKWRAGLVPKVYASSESAAFYLKHNDDKGDHILVDEDFNITGIIDWEYATTECEEIAFASPCMLWPVGEFYNGSNELSQDELLLASQLQSKGATRLSELIYRGRLHQRLWFFLGGPHSDYNELAIMFRALQHAYDGSQAQESTEKEVKAFETWKEDAWQKWSRDIRLKTVARGVRAKQRG